MKKLLPPLLLGLVLSAVGLIALIALAAVASGVLSHRPGDWTLRVVLAPHTSVRVNVPELVRLAMSPLGLRLLDGQTRMTPLGPLQFRRADRSLVLRCAPCRLDDLRLHGQPVAVDAIEMRLTLRDSGAIEGVLTSGDVQITFTATLRPQGIDVGWSLPPTGIAAVYRVLGDAIPEQRMARIEGRVQAHGTLRLPGMAASNGLSFDGFAVDGLHTERLKYGGFRFQCSGVPLPVDSGEGAKAWLPLDRMGAWLPAAVLAAEDQRFDRHPGFDLREIALALAHTSARGPAFGPTRGASTITQQLARSLFTGADRTAVRKLRELLYAVELEHTLGKPRILELYLNTIDWGPGVCGARAAARTYFGKRPAQLTPLESAWLASILRNPHAAHAQQFVAQAPDAERATAVLMQMRALPRRARERAARQALAFAPPDRTAVQAAAARLAAR